MKKFQTLMIALCMFTTIVNSADSKYQDAMQSAIGMLNSASGNDDFLNCANRFERIANAEKDLWLPYYYASYSCIMISFNEKDNSRRDLILDRAQQLLDSAFSKNPNESEVYVLQAFLYPSRIIVDPMGRGMIYMEKCFKALDTAKSLNPENPRIYYLSGIMKLNLPEAMGGGMDMAKSLFIEAEEKFRNFKPSDSLLPVWGEEANRAELDKIPE